MIYILHSLPRQNYWTVVSIGPWDTTSIPSKIAIWLEWKLTHSLNLWVFFSKKKKKMWVIERVHVQCILSYINIYIYIFFFEQLYNLVHEIRPPSNKMATWLEWKLTQPKFLVVIQRMYYNMKNDKIIIIFII